MADTTMSAGVGGSPQQQDGGDLIKQWQSKNLENPDGLEGTDGTPPEGMRTGKQAEKKLLLQGQVDVQEKSDALDEITMGLHEEVRKATGFGYATLTQYQLDSLQTGDPILLGHKGGQMKAPPTGSTGINNRLFSGIVPGPGGGLALFDVNPMVMYFKSYSSMQHLLKFITMVSSKLIVNGIKIDKEIGMAQAHATLEAGKAQAKGEETQAWMSLAAGCLGIISVGMSARAWMKARSAYSAEEKAQKATRDATTKKVDDKLEQNAKDISKLEKNIMAKENFQKKKFGKVGEEGDTTFTATQDQTVKKSAQKKAEKQEKAKDTEEQVEETKIEISKDTKKLTTEEKIERDFDNKTEAELAQSLKNDRKNLKAKKFENDQLAKKKEIAQSKYTAFKAGRLSHIGQSLQQDPMYMTWQALGGPNGALNNYLQAFGHFAQAKATLETAYWKAWEEMCGMYLGITNKGLDMAIQMQADASQQVNDITQALQKMSDQETNSMHWSG